MLGLFLFIIAYLLFFPLSIINFLLVRKSGYFRETAMNIDKLANREFRTLWNKTLKVDAGYPFGKENETISSALGKNELKKTLTRTGRVLVWVLNKLEKDHCINAINEEQLIYTCTKLTEPTPASNVFLWQIGSFVYALVVFINENSATIAELGFTAENERFIKVFGVIAYFLFTYFNFNKTTLKTH